MKTLWNGTLQLGRLAIPVGLASTSSEKSITFRTLHTSCKTRITLRPYCEREQKLIDVDAGELAPAWEPAKGQYLTLSREEKTLLEPIESRDLPISCFIDFRELDDTLIRKRYHLVPSGTVGVRGYAVLAEAMADLEVVALTRFTAWNSEQLGAISATLGEPSTLELATLGFAEDLVALTDDVAETIAAAAPAAELVEVARELVQRHTRALKPDDLASIERPRVRALLEAKLAGEPILTEPVQQHDETAVPVIDVETALRASLKEAPRRRRTRTPVAR